MLAPRERVEYSPVTDRARITWPNGERVALWIAPNIEHYEYLPEEGLGRDPWFRRVPHPDVLNYSIRDYGNRIGVWRMIDALDQYETPCTVSLNTAVLEHFPEIAAAIKARPWTIMSHGIYNTRYLTSVSEEDERCFYQDTIDTVLRHTGFRLRGMLGPAITGTLQTPDLMAEAGLTYHCDWVHDDEPVPIRVKQGRLISVPYTFEINDSPFFRGSHTGEYFAEIACRQFDRLYEEGKDSGRVMSIALHPYLIGQPHTIRHLRVILAHIAAHDGVWWTTADDIADYYFENYYA